jgi:HAD superfamily hydrolase (TIGR01662 family)
MNFDAILFDLDGTLTDSTRVFYAAVEESLRQLGGTLRKDAFDEWHSAHLPWKELLSMHTVGHEREADMQTLTFDAFDRLLKTDSEWIEGAEATVTELHERGYPLAIVTNSIHRFVDTLNAKLPLRTLFPVVITTDETQERRKPDPYGLLLAADTLGVKPERCMYVGDQRFDMLAANAAGMESCLYIGTHTPPDVELLAKRTIRSMPDLLDIAD